MTIVSVVADACKELKLPVPTEVIGSTDETVKHLLALSVREGKELRSKYLWPQLTKEHTFVTVASTAAYALPADLDYQRFQTQWDRTNHWPLRGPMSAPEWQDRKSGITTVTPRSSFRIKGYATNQFYVDPTPSSIMTFAFEYQTRSWILPVTYTTATTFLAGTYCSYDGVIYKTTAGGTTNGATPVADIGVTWVAQTAAYERFLADTDVSQIDENLITLGIMWRWKRGNGFEWQSYFGEYEEAVKRAVSSLKSAPVIPLSGCRTSWLLGPRSIPDSGFGS